MAKRKVPSSGTENEHDDDTLQKPKIKRSRSAMKVSDCSENQMEVAVCPNDSIYADDGVPNCSQMPDFDVQVNIF